MSGEKTIAAAAVIGGLTVVATGMAAILARTNDKDPETKKLKGKKWAKYRSNFPPLTIVPLHLDLHFDVRNERVIVTQHLTMRNLGASRINRVELDAKALIDIKVKRVHTFKPLGDVSAGGADFPAHVASLADKKDVKFTILKDKIVVDLGSSVSGGSEFVLWTQNTVKPTTNMLEGIYYDFTLPGKPKTMITQCQQYGFQRICPSVDRMAAKAFYTTTIVGDKRYTNLISNGDLAPGFFKILDNGGRAPVYQDEAKGKGPERKMIRYHNHKVNMASYLFFLGMGCYDTYSKTLEYPDGDCVDLELLSLPSETELNDRDSKKRTKQYMEALDALHDSVLWTYHSTGPEACEHAKERKEVKSLIQTREAIKANLTDDNKGELSKIRARLKELMGAWKATGYKYTGQTYREIGMQNSNYGGMENVGNTTILQSRLAPTDYISDAAYIYMEGVKIHEYYHNINGSQVTGMTPFEIWLNEAVTVHMERKRSSEIFGEPIIRIRQVARAFIPGAGPLATDGGPRAMPVEPEGFNITNELITGMTYFKAPEFVRMVETLMGEDLFNKGLHLYHETYKNSNATSIQWVKAMESTMKEAGLNFSLMKMAHGWLKRSGHPHVNFHYIYDRHKQTVSIEMEQTGFESITQTMDDEDKGGDWDFGADFKAPWEFPIVWSIVKDGKDTHSGVHVMNEAKSSISISGISEAPDFVSFARSFSFFGTYTNTNAKEEELALQAQSDPDLPNRYLAYRALADKEKARLVELQLQGISENKLANLVSAEYTKLHASILFDDKVEGMARALICSEGESIDSRPDLAHLYWEISRAKSAMNNAVRSKHHTKISHLFDSLEAKNKAGPLKDQLHNRSLKRHCLKLLASGAKSGDAKYKKNIADKAKGLTNSAFMSDRIFGLTLFLELQPNQQREASISEFKATWHVHMDACEEFIGVLCNLDCDESPKIIQNLVKDDIFNINLAGHARRVVRSWAANRKRSVLTDEGLKLTEDLVVTVGKVNQMSAYALLDAFGDLNKFDQKQKDKMLDTLRSMRNRLCAKKQESLYNQIGRLLA